MSMLRKKPVATFSIVAADADRRSRRGGRVEVPCRRGGRSVGGAGAGAVATQAYANASFGPRGIALMRDGRSAAEALAADRRR